MNREGVSGDGGQVLSHDAKPLTPRLSASRPHLEEGREDAEVAGALARQARLADEQVLRQVLQHHDWDHPQHLSHTSRAGTTSVSVRSVRRGGFV